MKILAIDPGNTYSAYCIVDSKTLVPIEHAKLDNEALREVMQTEQDDYNSVVIERVASYGMAVGREVFETCEWIGRYTELALQLNKPTDYVYRQEEKLHICHDSRAKDANIRRALIDRFAAHDLKNGKGTQANPDWFFGFKADEWSSYAVAITFLERGNT